MVRASEAAVTVVMLGAVAAPGAAVAPVAMPEAGPVPWVLMADTR